MPFETLDIIDLRHSSGLMACDDSFKGCLKFILVFFNIPIILIGICSLAVGVWILEDDASFFNIASTVLDLKVLGDDILHQAAVVMVTVGAVMIFLAGIGVIGALAQSSYLLGFYTLIMVVLLTLQVAVIVLGIVFKSEWEGRMTEKIKEKLTTTYGGRLEEDRKQFTTTFNTLQEKLGCCGWTSAIEEYGQVDRTHWDNAYDDGRMMTVPPSCCTKKGNGTIAQCTIHPENSTMFHDLGCRDAIIGKFNQYQWAVVGTAAGILGFQFLMIIFAIIGIIETGDTKYDMS